MSMTLEELEAEALKLPGDVRARLAERLLTSLEDDGSNDDPTEVGSLWDAEIQRRLNLLDQGLMATAPASDVIARARRTVQDMEPDARA